MAEPASPPTTSCSSGSLRCSTRSRRSAGTERAFSGAYWDIKDPGTYHCIVCDEALFSSDTKYDSGSGWPSFTEAIDPAKVTLEDDRSHGMVRTEAVCATCGAHLGHVFPDGPGPTGDRFCMNSAIARPEAGRPGVGVSDTTTTRVMMLGVVGSMTVDWGDDERQLTDA